MHKALCTFYIVLLCITLILLLATLGKLKKQENFKTCVCSSASSGRGQVCQDVNVVDAMYRDGKATEYTISGSKGWSTVSPGDLDFPTRIGCSDWLGDLNDDNCDCGL